MAARADHQPPASSRRGRPRAWEDEEEDSQEVSDQCGRGGLSGTMQKKCGRCRLVWLLS
jgi:hypothetical protein